MTTDNIEQVSIKALAWDIAADIYFPPGFDPTRRYPAIISAHPIGSCKEQTSGNVYGSALVPCQATFARSTMRRSRGSSV
jgi:uncharacterized protein